MLAVVVAGLAAFVGAPASRAAEADLVVKIKRNVTIVDGGRTAFVELKARCPEGAEILEAFAYLVQDDSTGEFGFFRLPCDGKVHELTVASTALEFSFQEGSARVSAYVLLTSGESISPTRLVRVSG